MTLTRCGVLCLLLLLGGCQGQEPAAVPLEVPRGYVATLNVGIDGQVYRFGPFVGYYFRPFDPTDLSRLEFLCFNERQFYTLDRPRNSLLYKGDAVLTHLPAVGFTLPASGGRIRPVRFSEAPQAWLEGRPEPRDEYVHFHSLYDAAGPARIGYWLRHFAMASFTYDMGARVGPQGPLYHRVVPGIDHGFARLIEFDQGP